MSNEKALPISAQATKLEISSALLIQAFYDSCDTPEVLSRVILECLESPLNYCATVRALCDSVLMLIEKYELKGASREATSSPAVNGDVEVACDSPVIYQELKKEQVIMMKRLDTSAILRIIVTTLVRLVRMPRSLAAVNAFNRALSLAKKQLSRRTTEELQLHYASMEGRGIISQCVIELPSQALRDFFDFWSVDLSYNFESQLLLQQKFSASLRCKAYEDCLQLVSVFKPYKHQWFMDYVENGVMDRLLLETPSGPLMKFAMAEKRFQKRVVDLYKVKDSRTALHFVKKFGFDIEDYPELLVLKEKDCVTYFLYVARMEPIDIADLFEGYDRLLSHLVVFLCKQYNSGTRHNFLGPTICYVYKKITDTQNPVISAVPVVDKTLSLICSAQTFQQEKMLFEKQCRSIIPFPIPADVEWDQWKSNISSNFYLTLSDLSYDVKSDVVWVQAVDQMNDLLDRLEKEQNCVAVDSEWRPGVCNYTSTSVALFQIAPLNERFVYLLDLASMGSRAYERLGAFFRCPKPVKVGVAFMACDWRKFQSKCSRTFSKISSYKEFSNFARIEGVVECSSLSESSLSRKSLSFWAKLLLNKEMDKSGRLINWEKRPLALKAACYAALDVAVIVKMLHFVMLRLKISSFESLLECLSNP